MIRHLIVYMLGCVALAHGELVFETLKIDGGDAKFGDKEFTAEFPFKNEGDETVNILSVQSSCGCTTPTLAKKAYAPGESGVIQATFKFETRSGFQEKKVTVTADDGDPNSRTVLRMSVTIPRLIDLKPRVLSWRNGSVEPKLIEVFLSKNSEAAVRLKEPLPQGFDVQFNPSEEEGVNGIITVTPNDPGKKRGKILLEVVDPSGKVLMDYFAFAIMR